jgi:uncharacterized phage-like protein YoqJ
MKIAFTGHRPNKLGGYDDFKNFRYKIMTQIDEYIWSINKLFIISGMALGVDQWVAEYAIDKEIPFDAYIPFLGQEITWPKESQIKYNKILSCAEHIVTCSDPGYSSWKMQKRNEKMVDDCDELIAVWDGSCGGTKNCVEYAKKVGKPIVRIIPPKLVNN